MKFKVLLTESEKQLKAKELLFLLSHLTQAAFYLQMTNRIHILWGMKDRIETF